MALSIKIKFSGNDSSNCIIFSAYEKLKRSQIAAAIALGKKRDSDDYIPNIRGYRTNGIMEVQNKQGFYVSLFRHHYCIDKREIVGLDFQDGSSLDVGASVYLAMKDKTVVRKIAAIYSYHYGPSVLSFSSLQNKFPHNNGRNNPIMYEVVADSIRSNGYRKSYFIDPKTLGIVNVACILGLHDNIVDAVNSLN